MSTYAMCIRRRCTHMHAYIYRCSVVLTSLEAETLEKIMQNFCGDAS